jgi:tRNA G46 methylase TrmB
MAGFLDPEIVLKQLGLQKSMVAADFGSGSGGWVIPLAKKLEEGKVFAIDILEESLSALKAKIKLEKIFNIETIKSDIEKTSTHLNIETGNALFLRVAHNPWVGGMKISPASGLQR